MKIKTLKERFSNPLYLESGRILEPYEIAYETYGELNEQKDNVILVTHALSGSHHAAGFYENDIKPGWWDKMIGANKPIDTNKYFVVCTNVIGSCFGSTGPMSNMYPKEEPYRFKFPVITINDMVRAQRILFSKLKIDKVKAIIGGSMGGMQALSFALNYPNFATKIIPLATTYASRPHVIASMRIMMEAISGDPDFKNGYYDPQAIKEDGLKGLSIARMVGFLDYLSPTTMDSKFGRNYVKTDGMFELFGRYEVERYLQYNGNNFPKWFDPLSYLYIAKAISIFDLSYGYDSLEHAIKNIKSKLYLIGFSGDTLFFPDELRELKNMFDRAGLAQICSYYEVQSNYGHDSFLVEVEKFGEYILDILEDKI